MNVTNARLPPGEVDRQHRHQASSRKMVALFQRPHPLAELRDQRTGVGIGDGDKALSSSIFPWTCSTHQPRSQRMELTLRAHKGKSSDLPRQSRGRRSQRSRVGTIAGRNVRLCRQFPTGSRITSMDGGQYRCTGYVNGRRGVQNDDVCVFFSSVLASSYVKDSARLSTYLACSVRAADYGCSLSL